jgi:hypothetical protein
MYTRPEGSFGRLDNFAIETVRQKYICCDRFRGWCCREFEDFEFLESAYFVHSLVKARMFS